MKNKFFLVLVVMGVGFGEVGYAGDLSPHGSLSNRYRLRTTGDLEDHDMESLLTLDVGDMRVDRLSASLQLGGLFDLDGNKGGNTYAGTQEALDARTVGRIYYGYLNVKDLGPISNLRVGRQHQYDFESLYFDGASLETDPFHHLVLGAYGGVPVHFFENQIGDDPGDWMLGGNLQWTPLEQVMGRVDFVHLRDKATGFRTTVGDREDNLIGATFWWDIDRHVTWSGRFTSFTDQVRDLSSLITLKLPEQGSTFQFNFFRLLDGYTFKVTDWDAFGIAGTYQPYTEISFQATQAIGKYFTLDGGFIDRFLDATLLASAFNHGYERAFLTFSLADLPFKDFSFSATGDYYHGKDNTLKNNTFGTTVTVGQKLFHKRVRLVGGTAYYLYRFNLLAGNESNNIQTYFGRVEGTLLEHLTARLGYEFENGDVNNFHTVDMRLIWSF